ncbi:hypothetical protein FQ775_01020 [Nitratireductor mangrovi]|uniref:DUF3168 domain-containing protein n=1 Tax=Nitratireductor mangrovi TaxID=2599600 RepID=A0A5B8KU02_9HYPH|nr:hypothetical protein [Nitratireductor mangrovi]QDY99063.1 hypothetical protein FQ775_01020 [Nitratireductor mangrovi]
MSLVSDIVARLSAIDPQVFSIVGDAAEFAAIDTVPLSRPAVYAFIKEEASTANERGTGPVLQRCEADVAVIIITDNVGDHEGAAASGDLEALKQTVRAALIGFVPDASQDGTPVEHLSGQLIKFRQGTVWHEELFAAAYYIAEVP